jgi:signal transduction histidine kinase
MKSLARRLLAPNLLLAIFTAAALGQVAWEATVRAVAAERNIDEVQTMDALVDRLNLDASDIQRNVLSYLLRPDDALLRAIDRLDADVHATIAHIGEGKIPLRGAVLWNEFVANQQLLEQSRKELLADRPGASPDQADALATRWRLASETRAALLADITTYNAKRLDQTFTSLGKYRMRWLLVLGAVIACSIGLAVLSFVRMTREVLRPLAAMTATADRIASEQAALEVEGAERRDEFGVLARAFNRMTARLVEANAKLAEAVRARDEFLSLASHELKTPLTAAKLQLQIESRRRDDAASAGSAPTPRWLSVSLRQMARLESLVASLLDVAQMRARGLELRRGTTDLSALVAAVVERFSGDLAKSGTIARLDLARPLLGPWDAERLDQVVTNLLANVVKYAPGAPVDVIVARREGFAVIEVRDRGPGLSPEIQERAFHPFERASNSRGVGGLGLGLFIAKGIVEAHGGQISAESRPGEGAAFIIRLPLNGTRTSFAEEAGRGGDA